MKQSHKLAAGVVASMALGIGVAVATANAQPGPMGGGMGPHMKNGMQHGTMGSMGPGAMNGGPNGPAAGQQLMTPEGRTAVIKKMQNAKTPEERQKIATATHGEMQKRAQEKGIMLPEQRGPRFGATPQTLDTTEHSH
jgi:hypothetical protein